MKRRPNWEEKTPAAVVTVFTVIHRAAGALFYLTRFFKDLDS